MLLHLSRKTQSTQKRALSVPIRDSSTWSGRIGTHKASALCHQLFSECRLPARQQNSCRYFPGLASVWQLGAQTTASRMKACSKCSLWTGKTSLSVYTFVAWMRFWLVIAAAFVCMVLCTIMQPPISGKMSLPWQIQHEQTCARQNKYAPKSPCKSTLCFCWAIKDANNKGPPHALCYLQIVLGVASVCIPTSSIGVHPILQHQCASQHQKCLINQ